MGKTILSLIILFTGGLIALTLLVTFLEPRLTFFPTRGLDYTPTAVGIPFKEISVHTEDGQTVYAWSLKPPDPIAELVFFHGNGGNLSLWQSFLVDMYKHSFSVLAVDYRGYGKSTGSPSEKGLYLDTRALLKRFWDEIHDPNLRVIYWGRSLGGSVAAFASRIREPDGLILEASFPTLRSLLNHYPVLKLLSFFSTYRFETIEQLRSATFPILILHGNQDNIVPLEQGQLLFDQLPTDSKYLHIVPGAHHNDVQSVDPESYWNRIIRFSEELNHGQDSS